MSDRHATCHVCGTMPFYDGHEKWCYQHLEDRLDELEVKISNLRKSNDDLSSWLDDIKDELYQTWRVAL